MLRAGSLVSSEEGEVRSKMVSGWLSSLMTLLDSKFRCFSWLRFSRDRDSFYCIYLNFLCF